MAFVVLVVDQSLGFSIFNMQSLEVVLERHWLNKCVCVCVCVIEILLKHQYKLCGNSIHTSHMGMESHAELWGNLIECFSRQHMQDMSNG